MFQRIFLGPLPERWAALPDLRPRELWSVLPLLGLLVAFGVYPLPLLRIANATTTELVAIFQRLLS